MSTKNLEVGSQKAWQPKASGLEAFARATVPPSSRTPPHTLFHSSWQLVVATVVVVVTVVDVVDVVVTVVMPVVEVVVTVVVMTVVEVVVTVVVVVVVVVVVLVVTSHIASLFILEMGGQQVSEREKGPFV